MEPEICPQCLHLIQRLGRPPAVDNPASHHSQHARPAPPFSGQSPSPAPHLIQSQGLPPPVHDAGVGDVLHLLHHKRVPQPLPFWSPNVEEAAIQPLARCLQRTHTAAVQPTSSCNAARYMTTLMHYKLRGAALAEGSEPFSAQHQQLSCITNDTGWG
jgi:hypothetical protein